MPIIRAVGLTKEFRRPKRHPGTFGAMRTLLTRQYTICRVVDDVTFTIDAGELVGCLGPNGAGKSTTIKMLTGILVPTFGLVEVAGLVPWRDRARNSRQIGVVFGQRSALWWDLPLLESFRLIQRLYDISAEDWRSRLDNFIDMLEMKDFLYTPVRQLSLGQRMRGDLAAAMLHQPRVLYLDEPTIGLDIVARERVREFISRLKRETGTTIILTTHDLADLEHLCDRLILIDKGHVRYDGSVVDLMARCLPHRELIVQLAPDSGGYGRQPCLADLGLVELAAVEQDTIRLQFDPVTTAVADLIAAVAARLPVRDVSIAEPDLESVLRHLYLHGDSTASTP